MRATLARLLRSIASRLDPSSGGLQVGRAYMQTFVDAERIAAIADQRIKLAFNQLTGTYQTL